MIIKLNIFSNKTSTVSVTLTVLSKSQNISENGSAFKKTERKKNVPGKYTFKAKHKKHPEVILVLSTAINL